ncbi:MAG: polyphosphate polymerase domain-containing protein [Oscillospiraceae bacterium]|nr:polyphosphate polymerase domain-containing protein [Oscillospiraceae bacterium]
MAGAIFERHEIKFLLDTKQRRYLENAIRGRMRPDEHGESTICNIYYDTPDYLMIRRSMEKPVYKEKIRMRSYGPAYGGDEVFLELKKKYKGVVYKRRISLPLDKAEAYMQGKIPMPLDSQIAREIDWSCHYYSDLSPAAHISYDRNAWFDRCDPELRLTFDRNILWQTEDCSLSALPYGRSLLQAGESLLEIKTAASIPMWLVSVLDEAEIRQTSFSKYGSAYTAMPTDYRMRGVSCA